ncbi:SpoIIE family protein phosphatase [Streptomyces sp. NPDC014746]|uniref:SpoIIE family protein phosphatase n=1 Tax=Streptomyces sp. NPDC014746 TaxID=3364904 RepID=UPI0036F814FB
MTSAVTRTGSARSHPDHDQSQRQLLYRCSPRPEEVAETQDNWARFGLAQATEMTCRQLEIPEDVPVVLLVSDGISDQVDPDTWEDLCREHADDPQALADALVAAAEDGELDESDGSGTYRDDATVVVLRRPTA